MKKILMIATGGTIASAPTENGLSPQLKPEELLRYIPDAKNICDIETLQLFNIDSTNISPVHWLEIANAIEDNYDNYDGFVITHGTDTLAYTASALSYLIQNSRKPIILTGSQKSMAEDSTDAKTNLLDSLRFAVSDESGIVIVFGGQVIAGTRAKKMRSKSYNAFVSINYPDIATVRDSRVIRYIQPNISGETKFYHKLNKNVFVLKLTPGMSKEAFLCAGEHCDGLIIESYGVGGIPDIYLHELEKLIEMGKIVIMATQVTEEGSDIKVYKVGHQIKRKYNIMETYDMTLESTVTKLMWAMGQSEEPSEIRKMFCSCINYDMLFNDNNTVFN